MTVEEDTVRFDNRWWLVAAAGLAVFMAGVDSSAITVALPAIETTLNTQTSATEWVVLGYALPLVALTIPAGRWLDRVGKRAVLVFSTAGFAAASAVAGLAPTIAALIGARVVQGVFGAALFALLPALTTMAVRRDSRGRAISVVTAAGPVGMITGPVLGGVVVQTIGWPWIFYLNLPVCVTVIIIGLSQIPADGPLRFPDRVWAAEAAVLGGAAAALLLALSLAARSTLSWFALALAAGPLLLVWWRMPASRTIRELMRTPGVTGPHLALGAKSTAIGLVSFLAPFYLQQVVGVSAAVTGLTILAFPLATAAVSPVAGILADRWDPRRTAVLGVVVSVSGLVLLVPLGQEWSPTDMIWRLALLGIGGGLFNPPNMTMAMSNGPRHLLATAGASTSATRQLGFAVGPALATVVWASRGYTLGGMRVAVGLAAVFGLLAFPALIHIHRRASAAAEQHTETAGIMAQTRDARMTRSPEGY